MGDFELLDTLVKILLMVALSGLLGMYFYYKGLKSTTARVTALLELFFPLFAVVLNWIFLGHYLEPVQMVGAFMLLLSSVVIQWKQF